MTQPVREQLSCINQQIKELAALYHGAASASGISDNEFWVWYTLLILDGDCTQQDICDLWSLPKQTVNSVVANLVRKALVTLEVVPGTRNRKRIRPTASGLVYGKAVVEPVYNAELRVLEQMSADERRACIDLLGKYVTLLRAGLERKG